MAHSEFVDTNELTVDKAKTFLKSKIKYFEENFKEIGYDNLDSYVQFVKNKSSKDKKLIEDVQSFVYVTMQKP